MKRITLYGLAILMALSLVISCDNTPQTKTFTVAFDTVDGTEVTTVQVSEGNTVTEPAIPTKEGYYVNFPLLFN